MSIDRQIDKEDVVHIYNGILLSNKKEQKNAICNNMDGPRDCQTEWSKSDTERQTSYDITYMWNLKKMVQINLFTKQKWSHRCKKQTYGYQRMGGLINWKIGIDTCTLLCIK